MSLYDDIRSNNKKKNTLATKSLIKNQKLLNLVLLITFSIIIIADILYVSKENIVGILGFTRGVMILAIILEIIFFLLLILTKFNNENLIFKIATIVVYSIPFIAYIPMFNISVFGIVSFILRLIFIALLITELVYSKRFIDKRSYLIKYITMVSLGALILIISLSLTIRNQNRRIDYSYDKELGGYVVNDIYEGSASVEFKDNVVKFNDNSLKNYDNKKLVIPSSVKEVSKDAFKGSGIDEIHITSEEICIYEALVNSSVKEVYLDNLNTKIVDINDASYNSHVRFIVPKEYINQYRNNNEYGFLFVPNTDDGEYYVVLNNTNSDILYYKAGSIFNIPSDIKNPKNDNFILNGFKYTFSNKKIESFPLTVNDNLELTAIWSYMIIYHENGGILNEEDKNKEIIDGDIVTPITPMRFGYDFDGWYDNEELKGESITSVSVCGTELYAKWSLSKPNIIVSDSINKVYDSNVSNISIDVYHDLDSNEGFNLSYDWYAKELLGYNRRLNISTNYLAVSSAQKESYFCVVTLNYLGDSISVISDSIDVNIMKADYDLSQLGLSNKVYEYNGEAQYPTISNLDRIGDGKLSCEIIKNDSTITNAGASGMVTYKFDTTSTNYNKPDDISISIMINPKTIDVNWDTLKFTYNNSKQIPTGTLTGIIGNEDVELVVNDKNSINAGSYQTSIRITGLNSNNYRLNDDLVNYVIDKAVYDYTPDESLISKTLTYNGEYQIINLLDLPNELSISSETEGIKDYTISGSILYKFISNDDNYYAPDDIRISNITIKKRDISASISNDQTIYNGQNQKPLFTLNNVILGDDVNIVFDELFMDAGEYNLSDISLSGNDKNNYNLSNYSSLKFTIKPASVNIIWSNLETTYNGEIQYPKAQAYVSGTDISFEVLCNGYKDAGDNLEVNAITNSNYNIINNGTTEFSIKPLGITINWDKDSFVFDNKKNNPQAQALGTIGDDIVSINYVIKENDIVIDKSINAGIYSITASIKSNNYKLVGNNLTKSYEILKASLEDDCKHTIEDVTKVYDGNQYVPNVKGVYYTFSNTLITYEFDKSVSDCGTYTIKVIFNADDNFNELVKEATVTINKRELTLTLSNNTFVYNEKIQKPDATINNIINGDDVSINITNNTVDASDNDYILTYELEGTNALNYIINNTYTYRINRKPIEIESSYVSIENKTYTYDGKSHSIEVEINNFNAKAILDKEYVEVGNNQVVTISFESTDNNYIITNTMKGYVNILKKELTISVLNDENNKLIYSKKVLKPSLGINGVIDGEEVNININNESIDAGTYVLDLSISGANSNNYSLSNTEITYVIYPKALNVIWEELEFTFNNNIQTPEAYVTVLSGDICDVLVNTDIESKNVGTYQARATLSNSNYEIASNGTTTFEITKAELSVTYEFSNIEFTYDGLNHIPTLKSYTTIANDKSKITYEFINSGKNAGTHEISCVFMTSSNNYNDLIVKTNITIYQKEIDVVFRQLQYEYTNENIIPEITEYNGLIDGDEFYVEIQNLSELISKGTHTLILKNYGKDKDNYVINNTYNLIIKESAYKLEGYEIVDYIGIYDGSYHTVTVNNLPDWITVSYGSSYKDVCSNEKVVITFTSNDSNVYIENSQDYGYVTINKRELIVDVEDTLVYNGNYQNPSYTLSNILDSDKDNLIVTFNELSMNSGIYTANISINNTNYVVSDSSDLTYEIIGCDVTLVWDSLTFTYSKSEITPTAHVLYNGIVIDTTVTVITNGKCQDVGIHTATATLSDNNYKISNTSDITKEFVIEAYGLSVNWSNTSLSYDGSSKKPVAFITPISGDNCNVTVITDNNVIPGTYQAQATVSNSNYVIVENEYVNYIINKGSIDSLPTYDSVSTYTYDGLNHKPYISNNVYASDASLIIYECDEYKDSGNYYVDITFKTENGYYEDEVRTVELVINPLELIIMLTDTNLKYDGSIKVPSFTYSNNISGDDINVSITNTSSVVGNYNCTFVITGNDSNNYQITNTYSYTIIKGDLDLSGITYSSLIATYDGAYHYPVLSNLPNGLSIDYDNSVGVKYYGDDKATIAFKLSDTLSVNYNVPDDIEVDMIINSKTVSLEFTNLSIPYDGDYHIPTVEVLGKVNGDNIDVIYSNDNYKNNINVGNYTIVITGLTNSNYKLEDSVSKEYEIIKGDYDISGISFNPITVTYDGAYHISSISGDLPSDVSVTYEYDGNLIDAGTYNVTAVFTSTNPNYNDIDSMESTITINPKAITLSWNNLSLTYNGEIQMPTCEIYSGLILNDSCDITVTTGKNINSGTYQVQATLSNSNYVCNSNTTKYTINPIELEVTQITVDGKTGPNVSFDFDGKYHTNIIVTYDSSNVLSGESAGNPIIDTDSVGILATYIDYQVVSDPYEYYISFENPNYIPQVTSGTITINNYKIYSTPTLVQEDIYTLPTLSYEINGVLSDLTNLGDGTNTTYYQYYKMSNYKYVKLDSYPSEDGTYYIQVLSNYEGLSIADGTYMYCKFTYKVPSLEYSFVYKQNVTSMSNSFITLTSNDSYSKIDVEYEGVNYDYSEKLDGAGGIQIDLKNTTSLVIYCYATKDSSIKIGTNTYTVSKDTVTKVEVTLDSGSYEILKASGESKVFRIDFTVTK